MFNLLLSKKSLDIKLLNTTRFSTPLVFPDLLLHNAPSSHLVNDRLAQNYHLGNMCGVADAFPHTVIV